VAAYGDHTGGECERWIDVAGTDERVLQGGDMRDPHVRLTEEEQRRLEALEAALTAEDPRLARRLRSGRRLPIIGIVLGGGGPSRGLIGACLLLVGGIMAVSALLISIAVAIAGCVALAAGGYLMLTCPRAQRIVRRFDAWFLPRFFRSSRERRGQS
jgi:hypothetical protein